MLREDVAEYTNFKRSVFIFAVVKELPCLDLTDSQGLVGLSLKEEAISKAPRANLADFLVGDDFADGRPSHAIDLFAIGIPIP